MALRLLSFGLLAIVAAALCAVQPAAAKEGVEATLNTVVPLDASPHTKLKVAWSLAYVDEQGRRRPFGANAVFVRLLSRTGAGAETAYVPSGPYANGEYSATVEVPEGGVRDVQIGLRGFTSGANGTHNADVLFPITNDPLPGVARVIKPAAGTDWTPWILGSALLVSAFVGVALLRRRNPGMVARG
jgi:hypothetical protein